MPAKNERIIIDTNLWISYLLTKEFSRVDQIFKRKKPLALLFSVELLDEFIAVSQRPRLRRYFSIEDTEILIREIQLRAEFITVTSTVNVCRDPKDNFLLALAKDGSATHLITGDKDLLVLKKFEQTRILTISEYLKDKKQ